MPKPRAPMGGQVRDLLTVEPDPAAVPAAASPNTQFDERGLARPVGADQPETRLARIHVAGSAG